MTLIETWHPVTSDMGLIDAFPTDVVSELLEWHNSIDIHYERSSIDTSLSEAFQALLPLSHSQQRRLFVSTKSDWTACFQNGTQGSDPFPAMSTLAVKMGVLSMRVCSTPPKAVWPATMWEVYAPESLGGKPPLCYRRSIAAANDGGRWVFEEGGEPFDFERPEFYQRRLKRERFPRELLAEYLEHFELQPFDDEFYRVGTASPAILLQQTKPVFKLPEYTLEQVVAGDPWKR